MGLPKGKNGVGMITAVAFEIPAGAADYWQERLHRHNIRTTRETRFGDEVIVFSDPHGLVLELVASGNPYVVSDTSSGNTLAHMQRIKGFHSATALLKSMQSTKELLVHSMGMVLHDQEGNRFRFEMKNDTSFANFYDLVVDPEAESGQQGGGSVHHIAFRTPTDDEQIYWQQSLREDGYQVTMVRDRKYFKSVYFHEPGGVLFEIATDPPGFTVDEPLEHLGHSLQLPEHFEQLRMEIESHLPPLRTTEVVQEFIDSKDR
jgi:glyoxalase family protein